MHYVYKITFTNTNEYYIGKHSTVKDNDGYLGSSTLTNEKIANEEVYIFEIIEYYDSSIEAYNAEKEIIGLLWKSDPLCLNKVPGGKGGWEYNNWSGIPKSEEHKQKIGEANSKPKTGKGLIATIANAKLGAEKRRGQKDSIEVKEKRAKSVSAATKNIPKPYRRKTYIIEGIKYLGMDEIVIKYGISRQTVHNRINNNVNGWSKA